MGLDGYARSYPHVLSGGQQQRCALLRALAPEPDILLLDEPFSNLDVTLRADVRDQALALLKERRVTTLVVTHDPQEAMAIAERLWILYQGRVVQSGTPEEVYARPRHASIARLFGPVNSVPGVVRGGSVATPLGAFEAPELGEGAQAEVLIRPEALKIGTGEQDGHDGGGGRGATARRADPAQAHGRRHRRAAGCAGSGRRPSPAGRARTGRRRRGPRLRLRRRPLGILRRKTGRQKEP